VHVFGSPFGGIWLTVVEVKFPGGMDALPACQEPARAREITDDTSVIFGGGLVSFEAVFEQGIEFSRVFTLDEE